MTEKYTYDQRDRLTEISAFGEVSTSAAPEVKERYYAALARQPSRYAPWVMLSFAGLLLSAALAPLGWIGVRDRRRRRQVRHSSIALFMCVCMSVDPEQVYAMNDEAIRAHAMIAAGIGALGQTTTTFAYDNNGNQISKQVDQGIPTEYTFDAENRLIAFGPQGAGPTAQYTYDADGVRKSKTAGASTTYHLTDKNRPYAQVIEEIDTTTPQTPVRLMHYVYGDDLIAQTADPSGVSPGTSYLHYDGQMSTRQLTDDNGASSTVTDHYKYDAFGQQLIASPGSTANKYLYTGEQYDSDLNEYYLRARYYDHSVGRFMSRDSFGGHPRDPISLHKYLYANADPTNRIDPGGTYSYIGTIATTAISFILFNVSVANAPSPSDPNIKSRPLDSMLIDGLSSIGLGLLAPIAARTLGRFILVPAANVIRRGVVRLVRGIAPKAAPRRVVRVIDATLVGKTQTLGRPTATDVLVTVPDDIADITTARDLAERLTLIDDQGVLLDQPKAILEFNLPPDVDLVTPTNVPNPGFIEGGYTAGGAREYAIPNFELNTLSNLTIRYVE